MRHRAGKKTIPALSVGILRVAHVVMCTYPTVQVALFAFRTVFIGLRVPYRSISVRLRMCFCQYLR